MSAPAYLVAWLLTAGVVVTYWVGIAIAEGVKLRRHLKERCPDCALWPCCCREGDNK